MEKKLQIRSLETLPMQRVNVLKFLSRFNLFLSPSKWYVGGSVCNGEVKVEVGYMPCMGKQEKGREQGPSGLLLLEAD